jgi:hypothetical protein
MEAAFDILRAPVPVAAEKVEPWLATHAAPAVELPPLTRPELLAWFQGGEPEADRCEALLAFGARAIGSLYVSFAEGLAALRRGDRLEQLGCHLDDYAREVLDLEKGTTDALERLGRALRSRPLLREAMRSGKVALRAGQLVAPVAVGEAEAEWISRASRCTVRELEEAVRRAKRGEDPDEEWLRFGARPTPAERVVLDAGLEVAGRVLPGSSRMERFEAMAQELLAVLPRDPDADPPPARWHGLFSLRPGQQARRAALEAETERWRGLPAVADFKAPDVRFDDADTAQEIDAKLRPLAGLRSTWNDLVGWCAHALEESGIAKLLGFDDFRHYVAERLRLPARAVEQRAALEKKLWGSPALQEARRQKLSYEKLRLLARLPEEEIASWTPRAHALTCIELRRKLDGEAERQMREAGKVSQLVPRRIALVLAAVIEALQARFGKFLPVGTCLAVMAKHFIDTWKHVEKRARTRSQKIRDRDGRCMVPGCSHRASHSHHIISRARGGTDDPWNLVSLCAFHHLRCIHGGYLRVFGRAPEELTWFLGGNVWNGPGRSTC